MPSQWPRKLIRGAIVLILRTTTNTEIEGLEKLRAVRGKAIAVANHLGRLDPGYVFLLADRDDIIMVVAEKYREVPIARWLVKQLDLLWLERFEVDLGTIKEVLRRLDKGGILFISPEGTRSQGASLLEGKPGVAYLAAKSGAPIIPFSLVGTEDRVVLQRWRKLGRARVRISFGDPFTVPPLPKVDRDVFLRQQTDEIMARIAALLPENYRGAYAKHPRVVQLIV